ncbi:related to nuclear transport factor 2 domain protein [Phialocephala subalpina]|uniref:Related to nuclear transport factor 2 domain protein n=1 Tax=Phialocephala subalpina TaxID=576137 RepID=A0A1L7WYV2_9HELO|nr:related to nuclear transport factor 2 domain protein [Phialocephala subalpina]
MTEPTLDPLIEVTVAGVAAQDFIDAYYPALNNPKGRASIADFYVKPVPGKPIAADIVLNGVPSTDPTEIQKIFDEQVTKAHYEVQTFDCHTINANYNVAANESALALDMDGKKMSIVVIVGGTVKYGEDGDVRAFSDSLVLVPNLEAHGPKAAKGLKKWLVQSQNFRLVL